MELMGGGWSRLATVGPSWVVTGIQGRAHAHPAERRAATETEGMEYLAMLMSEDQDPWWAPFAVVALALLLAWAATAVYP